MNKKYKMIIDPIYKYKRVDPLPTREEVEKYYLEEFYSSNYKQFNDSSLEVQTEEKIFFESRWEQIFDICNKHFKNKKNISLFDIGFGYAQALLYFKNKGYKVSGIEPSKEGVEYAQSQGLNVFHNSIEDFSGLDGTKYDVVTLLNVLEHLRDPVSILKNIKKVLLKNNGLLIIDVPNEFNDFQVVANQEYHLKEWWLCPPNHINYFSCDSLVFLLKKCGYDIVRKESSFPLEIFLLMGDLYIGNSQLGKECHNKRVKFEYLLKKHGKKDKLNQLYGCLADLNLGRQIVIYCSPKKTIRSK